MRVCANRLSEKKVIRARSLKNGSILYASAAAAAAAAPAAATVAEAAARVRLTYDGI